MPKKQDPADGAGDGADLLLLEAQLCFPLYAASRLMTRVYQPHLEPLGLTYPQYVVLMILWEDAPCPISHIGDRALLSTNTLTPLLKRLELLGYISRTRSHTDERVVEVGLTDAGRGLRDKCACIPTTLLEGVGFPNRKIVQLKTLLDEFITAIEDRE